MDINCFRPGLKANAKKSFTTFQLISLKGITNKSLRVTFKDKNI